MVNTIVIITSDTATCVSLYLLSCCKPEPAVIFICVISEIVRLSAHDEVCGSNSLLFTCPGHFRLIDAIGFFGKVVACVIESARPAAFADLLVLACPAFAFQQLGVTQFLKDRRIVPDIYEFLFLYVTCLDWQVTAG